MLILATGDEINPLGHVLDHNIVGGPDAIWLADPHGMPLITVHMVTMVAAVLLLLGVMMKAAGSIATGDESQGTDRYLARNRLGQLVEVIVLYLRDKAIRPVLGHNTERYLPYLLTVFFFILLNNLFGLLPLMDVQHLFGLEHVFIGGTATGNIAVTGGLALLAFIIIQVHGVRDLGLVGWARHLLGGAPWWLFPIMVPVELMSMFIKPCALAIRLFANMLAGHTLMATLSLFGLMAYQGTHSLLVSGSISLLATVFSVGIMFLELFIAFLQSFIFMFLTAVFIGQLTHHAAHGEGSGPEPAAQAAGA